MFSLNSVNSVTKILYFKNIVPTCHLLCKRPRCYQSASKTQVAQRIFKLNPFMLQWFTGFPEFAEFTEFLIHLGKSRLSLLHVILSLRIHFHVGKTRYVWNEIGEKPHCFPMSVLSHQLLFWTFSSTLRPWISNVTNVFTILSSFIELSKDDYISRSEVKSHCQSTIWLDCVFCVPF